MAEIEDSLLTVRQDLAAGDPMALDRALDRLADLGAKIGRLQVGCCAPIRMPLYAEALAHLNTIQLRIVTVLGLAH